MTTPGDPASGAQPEKLERSWAGYFDTGQQRLAWEFACEAVKNSRKVAVHRDKLKAAIDRLERDHRLDIDMLAVLVNFEQEVLDVASNVTLHFAKQLDTETLWQQLVAYTGAESRDWAEPDKRAW